MLLRRLTLAATALTPVLLALPAASAAPLPLPQPLYERVGDHLVVSLTDNPAFDGQYDLRCHPVGGNHPYAKQACAQLDSQTRWGSDLFAPVGKGDQCTMIYGGPQRAKVTGTWAGRPVNAQFNRTNGCETARWNRFSSLLGNPESSPMG
jgi:Subtilisin inhibitor-like